MSVTIRVLPKDGRIGKARQIGAAEIEVTSASAYSQIEDAIVEAFKKTLPRHSYIAVVNDDTAAAFSTVENRMLAEFRLYRMGADDA